MARNNFSEKHAKALIPSIVAIAAVELLAIEFGYNSNAFSIVAAIFLAAVVYTALHHGVKDALTSAFIILLYNTISLTSVAESFSFEDRSVRRIVLLAAVLPAIAFIIGRLKERNDRLLHFEKRARLKAEESEQRMRFMAESMPQKVYTANPDGTIDYFNPQWAEYTGLPYETARSSDWTKIIHPDDVQENIIKWKRSLKTGKPFSFEHRLLKHDGTYRWHISRAHAMRDTHGNITKWIGSTTDIHDIKLAHKRESSLERKAANLAEQREQLLTINKAKDEFISLSSHQLRTPATGVKQYIGMVLQGYAGEIGDEQREFLEQAYVSNERQITIINDLLKVAQIDAGKVTLIKKRTDIVPLLQDIINEQADKFIQRHQQLVFEPKQKSLYAMIDKSNLRMALENIIDNASKYTPGGKTIQIVIKKTKRGITIAIKDEGVGIAQKDIDKIFTKFSRIDNPLSVAVGGTGLGLYWAQKIVDLHGGRINVTSEINKGTTFTIQLPA